ncbi:MAG: DUF1491 family protein [Alphaproteobacteria bacterium]|nr:DUF1491 family protein [Alphaproteobacteria bacterium]
MIDKPPTDFLVAAQTRIASEQGVSMVVRHRGDAASGTVLLKIDLLDGTARVLSQVQMDNELVWSPVSRNDPMPNEQAESYLEKQLNFDPDMWVVEIEDRKGRHWFPGRVVAI